MDDEFTTIRTKLLDYELNGITKLQKDVLSNAIEQLLKDALGKRDALAVINIQRLQTRLNALMPGPSITEQTQSSKKIHSEVLPVAIFIIGLALALVTNIASNILPPAITPYLWLSWPLLALLAIISAFLIWKQ